MPKNKKKKKSNIEKRLLASLVFVALVVLVLMPTLMLPQSAEALIYGPPAPTFTIKDIPRTIWDAIKYAKDVAGGVAFKNALRVFYGRIVNDVAVYIASGGRGQQPLFIQNPGRYLQETADSAAVEYLDTISTRVWNQSVCSPRSTQQKIIIEESVGEAILPFPDLDVSKKCSLTDVWTNLNHAQVVTEARKTFNPENNDIGRYFALYSQGLFERMAAEKEAEQEIAEGLQSPETVTGEKISPSELVEAAAKKLVDESTKTEEIFTGTPVDSIINLSFNSLVRRVLVQIFQKGFGTSSDSSSGFGGLLAQQGISSGRAAAQAKFASLSLPAFTTGGSVDLLNDLASCPTDGAGFNNCIIDPRFRLAIEQKMTIQKALDDGYLDYTKPFGYDQNGLEPPYLNGYPHRSLVILRKYRVLPVGAEIAAKYIKEFGGGSYGWRDVLDGFDNSTSPFYQLVDPNWLLKAPENYCKRRGFGEETIFEDFVDDDGVEETDQIRFLQRKDVCVDEQTCIAEKEDGSCLAFGYCTNEKHIWRFAGQQCDAQFNSCQTYVDPAGASFAYLENTLNFDTCSAPEGAGCLWYCEDYSETDQLFGCYLKDRLTATYDYLNEDPGTRAFLNGQTATCSESAAGCSEFIRTEEANLFSNASFEYFYDQAGAINLPDDGVADYFGICDENSPTPGEGCLTDNDCGGGFDSCRGWIQEGPGPGSNSFAVSDSFSGNTAINAQFGVDLEHKFDTGYPLYNRTFTSSFYARALNDNNDCDAQHTIIAYDSTGEYTLDFSLVDIGTDWGRQTLTITIPDESVVTLVNNYLTVELRTDDDGDCTQDTLVDAIQLEENNTASDFQNYGSPGIYLNGERESCRDDEVGCELYTPVSSNDPPVPGIVNKDCDPKSASCNLCPAEFVGCQAYQEMPLTNNPPNPDFRERTGKYCSDNQSISCLNDADCGGSGSCLPSKSLVASTGEQCSASGVGCEEYTNLDLVAQGGEGLEYYTYIRPCNKPDDAPGECNTYYSWFGSDEAGFQLRAYNLRKSNRDEGPCNNIDPSSYPYVCDDDPNILMRDCQEVYGTDPDCREFYNPDPAVQDYFYRYFSRTVSCSNDCHPLRNSLDNQTYYAIPDESTSCSASATGCREYKGNAGYNIAVLFDDDFEDGTKQGWSKGSVSGESVNIGGHSLSLDAPDDTEKDVSTLVTKDKTYILTFWAKDEGGDVEATDFEAHFSDGANDLVFSGSDGVEIDGDWKKYTLGPLIFSRSVGANEVIGLYDLRIVGAGGPGIYYDNIRLEEASDSVYLVKNTATSCLGQENCQEYEDQDEETYYIKSFTKLCDEDKVGCETLISTQNSTNPFAENYPDRGETGVGVTVPADSTVTLVNDANKYCLEAEKGCKLLGKPEIDQQKVEDDPINALSGFSSEYLIDDPDRYQDILCSDSQLYCQEYRVGQGPGTAYFKDPGTRTCEWRRPAGIQESNWYKTEVDPNDLDEICGSNIFINQTPPKEQEDNYWTGLCPADQTGCTEYIDPQGEDGENIIENGDFEAGPLVAWNKTGSPIHGSGPIGRGGSQGVDIMFEPWTNVYYQYFNKDDQNLEPQTVYEVSGYVRDNGGAMSNEGRISIDSCNTGCPNPEDCPGGILSPDDSMVVENDATGAPPYDEATIEIPYSEISDGEWHYFSGLFYSGSSTKCEIIIGMDYEGYVPDGDGHVFDDISVKKASAYYYLEDTVDKASCNGEYDLRNGCVLFNDTSDSYRAYDSFETHREYLDGFEAPIAPENCAFPNDIPPSGDCDSNSVIQVTPDRVCNEWLSCETGWQTVNASGETENLCLEIQKCNELGATGECLNAIGADTTPENITGDTTRPYSAEDLKTMSGLVVAGFEWDPAASPPELVEGYYPFSDMQETGLAGANINDLVPNGNLEPDPKGGIAAGSGFLLCELDPNTQCLNNGDCTPGDCNYMPWSAFNTTSIRTIGADITEQNTENKVDENNFLNVRPEGNGDGARVWLNESTQFNNIILAGQEYTVSFKIRYVESPEPNDRITVGFGYDCADDVSSGTYNVCQELEPIATFQPNVGWQEYVFGPHVSGNGNPSNPTLLYFVQEVGAANPGFQLDDVSLKPALAVQSFSQCNDGVDNDGNGCTDYTGGDLGCSSEGDTSEADGLCGLPDCPTGLCPISTDNSLLQIARSCRAYPDAEALQCEYTDSNLVTHKGWYGYCIEKDPHNENICLTWWPVDIIAGDSDVFGGIEPAGYQDRAPLYFCSRTNGRGDYEHSFRVDDTTVSDVSDDDDTLIHYYCDGFGNPQCETEPSNEGGCAGTTDLCPNITESTDPFRNYEIEKFVFKVSARPNNEWPSTNTVFNVYFSPNSNYATGGGSSGLVSCDNTNQYGCDQTSHANCEKIENGSGRLGIPNSSQPFDFCWVHTEPTGKDNDNAFRIRAVFDANNIFRGYESWIVDDTDQGWVHFDIGIYAREACYEVVQTVLAGNTNNAWSSRTSSGSGYTVADLGYDYSQDLSPFGGLVYPADFPNDPTSWDGFEDVGKQPLYSEAPDLDNPNTPPPNYQARSGTPYACTRNCGNKICLGGEDEGSSCDSDLDCDEGGDNYSNGRCVGVGFAAASNQNLNFARERLQRLFADVYRVWRWDSRNSEYDFVTLSGESELGTQGCGTGNFEDWGWKCQYNWMPLCPGDIRPAEDFSTDADFCGIKPKVENIRVNGNLSGNIDIGQGGSVQLSFNTSVDSNQLPLESILIDWGDSPTPLPIPWGGMPRGDESSPHIFTHTYTKAGTYIPLLQIVDNWDWCNEGGRAIDTGGVTKPCGTWTPFDGTIIVQ